MGGGCDVIAAHSLAQQLKKSTQAQIVVANAKGPIPDKSEYTTVTPNILRVSPVVCTIQPGDGDCYGTAKIEESLPRGTDGCPFLISLPTKHKLQQNIDALVPEIQSLKFTVIIGIDMGGDSISGGIDHPGDAALGRDMQFKSILSKIGVPFYHVVAAPCCDGETMFDKMQMELLRSKQEGHMLGCFDMSFMRQDFETYTKNLDSSRTPNIVLQALNNKLEVIQKQPLFVKVPRNLTPVVPYEWVVKAWVLKYSKDSKI